MATALFMLPERLTEAIRLAYRHRHRDRRSYSLAAVGERQDGAVVRAINGWGSEGPDCSIHAECRCLKKLGLGGVIWVARVRKDGSVGCSRPCAGCRLMLRFSGVRAYYTINDKEYGCLEN